MPRTLSFPPPSTATCPICSARLSAPRCGTCGATFTGEDGATLWRVDHDLFDLCRIRNDVVHRLLTPAAPLPAPADPATSPAPATWPPSTARATDPAVPHPWSPMPGRRSVDPAAPGLGSPRSTDMSTVLAPSQDGSPHRTRGVTGVSGTAPGGAPTSVPGPDDGTGRAPHTGRPGAGVSHPAPPHHGGPGPGDPSLGPSRPRPSFTAAEVLVGLGALSLVAAVAVFAAVSWSDLAAWAQGGLIVGLTGLVLGAAVACRRRHLVATSESLGAVGVALGLADVQVARVGLDGLTSGRGVWAVGVGLVAVGAIALGRRTGIRVLALAGTALAFAPAVIASSGDRPLLADSALSVQALAALLARHRSAATSDDTQPDVSGPSSDPTVVARRWSTTGMGDEQSDDAQAPSVGTAARARLGGDRLERTVLLVGAAVSWSAAVVTGLVLAAIDLGAPVRPIGPCLVLAGLALGSIAVARWRRTDDGDLLGAAGAALALVPGLLVAVPGSALTVLVVLAVEALVALALAGTPGLTRPERAVAHVAGSILWPLALATAVLHATADLAFEDDATHRTGPLLVLGGLAVGAVVIGRLTRREPLTAAGAGAAFLPLPLAAVGPVAPTAVVAVLVGEALVAAVLARGTTGPVRSVVVAGGVVAWSLAVASAAILGLSGWLGAPVHRPAGSIALLVALAVVAVGAALLGRWDGPTIGLGLGATVVPVLLAIGLAAGGLGIDGWVATVILGAGVVALGVGAFARLDPERPWTAPWGVAGVAGAALAVVPARTVLLVVDALIDRATTSPDVGADRVLADWLRPAFSTIGTDVPGWPVVAQLAGAAMLVGAVALLHRRLGRALGALVAVGTLVVVPVAAGLTVGVTMAGLGLVVAAAAVAVRARPRDPELLAGGVAVILLGTIVSAASAPWTVGWTVLVGLIVSGLAVEALVRRLPGASIWVGAATGVVLAGVALDAWVLGVARADGLLAVMVTAAIVSPLAALLERRGDVVAADVIDGLVAVTLAGTLLMAPDAAGSVLAISPFLAVVGVTAAGAALRPRRRSAWLVATGSGLLLLWVQAGRAELDVVEAYTLPLAAWALLVGAVVGRRHGSWERFGVGLLAAAGPTTVLALVDPDPLRTVGVVAVGVAVAVWGAWARLQAPLAIGAGAVAILALRHLGPISVELPRYVTFAVAGLVLLAVGATFEQRRQDLRHARDFFARLR